MDRRFQYRSRGRYRAGGVEGTINALSRDWRLTQAHSPVRVKPELCQTMPICEDKEEIHQAIAVATRDHAIKNVD